MLSCTSLVAGRWRALPWHAGENVASASQLSFPTVSRVTTRVWHRETLTLPLLLLVSGRTIWLEDGIRGFYRGCATNLLRTTPAAALTFTSFELIARALRGVNEARVHEGQAAAAAAGQGVEGPQPLGPGAAGGK